MKKFKNTVIGIAVGVVAGVLVACAPAIAEDNNNLEFCGKKDVGILDYYLTTYEDKQHGKVIYLYNGNIAVEDIYNRR